MDRTAFLPSSPTSTALKSCCHGTTLSEALLYVCAGLHVFFPGLLNTAEPVPRVQMGVISMGETGV